MDLKGKIALVTGAARGIGHGIALKLAAEGVHLALVDRGVAEDPSLPYKLGQKSDLHHTVAAAETLGIRALPLIADVTRTEEVRAMMQKAVDVFGGIDILVNNAGVIGVSPVATMAEAQWDRIMEVNVKGVFLCSQTVIPFMTQRGAGRIINIASVAGKTGRAGVSAYCASKFAVIGFTQALAEELAPMNVTVNAVCPGYLRTAMWTEVLNKSLAALWGIEETEAFDRFIAQSTYLKREQTPEDIGDCVVFLCKADNITGASINVAGGGEVH